MPLGLFMLEPKNMDLDSAIIAAIALEEWVSPSETGKYVADRDACQRRESGWVVVLNRTSPHPSRPALNSQRIYVFDTGDVYSLGTYGQHAPEKIEDYYRSKARISNT